MVRRRRIGWFAPLALAAVLLAGCSQGLLTGVRTSISLGETEAPVPGGEGSLTIIVTPTTAEISWEAASDNVIDPSELQYLLCFGEGVNLSTVEDAIKNGTASGDWLSGVTSVLVTGLDQATTYTFNVLVRDAAQNLAAYAAGQATTASDTTAPTPGGGGTITIDETSFRTVSISWVAATDDLTDAGSIEYRAVYSTEANISTPAEILANGTTAQDWAAGITNAEITGLEQDTTYFFNIVARDLSGNRAAYTTETTTTLLDTTAPVPGGGGTITVDSMSYTQADLSWVAASDNFSASAALEYRTVHSLLDNIGTVGTALSDGTLGSWTGEMTAATIPDLTPDTTYYFNILVRDEAGKTACYTSTTDDTLPDLDPPVPGGAGGIALTVISQTQIDLSWSVASDPFGLTPQADLEYNVYSSTSGPMATFGEAQAIGTSITSGWVVNINSESATSLDEFTQYYFNVFVRDDYNNIAAYDGNVDWTRSYSRVFYTRWVTGTQNMEVRSVRTNGTDDQLIVAGPLNSNSHAVVVDPGTGELYYGFHDATTFDGEVWVTNLDGSATPDLVMDGLGQVSDVELDHTTDQLYIVDGTNDRIYRISNKTRGAGAGSTTPILSGSTDLVFGPRAIAIDEQGQQIYWANADPVNDSIGLSGLGGETPGYFLLTNDEVEDPQGIAIGSGYVYWANNDDGEASEEGIWRAGLGDPASAAEVIATGLVAPRHVALDTGAGEVYWCETFFVQFEIHKAPVGISGGDAGDYTWYTPTSEPQGLDVLIVP